MVSRINETTCLQNMTRRSWVWHHKAVESFLLQNCLFVNAAITISATWKRGVLSVQQKVPALLRRGQIVRKYHGKLSENPTLVQLPSVASHSTENSWNFSLFQALGQWGWSKKREGDKRDKRRAGSGILFPYRKPLVARSLFQSSTAREPGTGYEISEGKSSGAEIPGKKFSNIRVDLGSLFRNFNELFSTSH